MIIDAHVHLRNQEGHEETIAHGLQVAKDSGVSAVGDMPNTKYPIIDRETLTARLKLVKEANIKEVTYGIYLGVTTDSEQLRRGTKLYNEFKEVWGFKYYAGESVGNLAITKIKDQKRVFTTFAEEGYEGLLIIHAEEEEKMCRHLWDYHNPRSHGDARPPEAETTSIEKQIVFARSLAPKLKLHFTHLSLPESVRIVNQARNYLDISCDVAPHHFLYDLSRMDKKDGILYKMNPPLRPEGTHEQMLSLLKQGKIDWIATDHAPHPLKKKFPPDCSSGIPGLANWPFFKEFLRQNGFSEKQIFNLTFGNAQNRLGLDVNINNRPIKNRTGDYPFNPYKNLEEQLGFSF